MNYEKVNSFRRWDGCIDRALIFILIKSQAGNVSLSPTQAVEKTLIRLTIPPAQTKTPDLIPTRTMTLIPSPTPIPTMIGGGSGEIGFYQQSGWKSGDLPVQCGWGEPAEFDKQPLDLANRLYLQMGIELPTFWIMIF